MWRCKLLATMASVVVAVLASTACGQAKTRVAFSDAAVAGGIERARAHLWSLYREDARLSPWPDKAIKYDNHAKKNVPYENHGGYSALAMYALLASGDKATDPRMKRAIDWLVARQETGTYVIGMRMQVWTFLPPEMGRPLLARDMDLLLKNIYPIKGNVDPAQYGTYHYHCDGKVASRRTGDNSNTHIAILGAWAAARCNIEIPSGYWQLVYDHWKLTQNKEGGWQYGIKPGPGRHGHITKDTMTAAGLASLFVAYDNLYNNRFVRCGANTDDPVITKALGWFDRHFFSPDNAYERGSKHYFLFAMERVGLACGYKYFGKKDWYRLGAVDLLNSQGQNGSWRGGYGEMQGVNIIGTSFGLLFLARGRNPLLLSRLKYDGDWNNRPRALANLTGWVGRSFEREVNWQIVDIATPGDDWHDSQVLTISGAGTPKLSEEELAKLRTFVEQGGTLLSVAECGSQGLRFDKAMREAYAKMFPAYELTMLPPDHAVYGIHFPLRSGLRLWMVSNGVRPLAFHTSADLTLPWQRNLYATQSDAFKLATNVAFYSNDRSLGHARGASPWPPPPRAAPARTVGVVRIRHSGNWNPEPLALERLGRLMRNGWGTKLDLGEPVTCDQLDAKRWPVAFLTGTGELALPDAQKQALKAYVAAGGTIVIDAAGGDKEFAAAAVALVSELYGDEALVVLEPAAEVYRLSGMEIRSVSRREGGQGLAVTLKTPRVQGVDVGGRTAVFVSREDLTTGLIGCPAHGCAGYSPDSAVEIARNIVLYASALRSGATTGGVGG